MGAHRMVAPELRCLNHLPKRVDDACARQRMLCENALIEKLGKRQRVIARGEKKNDKPGTLEI